jgi:hypothetical protein
MKFCDQLHCGVLSSLWSVRSERRRRRLWMLLEMLLLLFVVAVRQVSAGSKTRGISPQGTTRGVVSFDLLFRAFADRDSSSSSSSDAPGIRSRSRFSFLRSFCLLQDRLNLSNLFNPLQWLFFSPSFSF